MQEQTSQDGNEIKRIYIVSFTGGGRDRLIFVDKYRADKVGLVVNNLGTVIFCAPDTKNIPKVADRHFISQEHLARSTSVWTSYCLLAFHPASYLHYILPPLNLSFMTASWVALPRRIRGNRCRVHCFWNLTPGTWRSASTCSKRLSATKIAPTPEYNPRCSGYMSKGI